MRWFLILAVATAALVLADPAPAKAQVIVGGYPTYTVPLAPYPRILYPASSGVIPFGSSLIPYGSGLIPYGSGLIPYGSGVLPYGSGVIPYANGGPVEFALNRALWSMASRGYGPYAGYYSPYAGPWGAWPYTAPAPNWKWVDPWSGNNGWHKGWYKPGGNPGIGGIGGAKGGGGKPPGKGGGKGGKGGKGKG